MVGDKNDHGKPTNIHRRWPIPYMLKKLGVSKPNIAPLFFPRTTIMSQGATCDLGVMFEFVTSVRIHG